MFKTKFMITSFFPGRHTRCALLGFMIKILEVSEPMVLISGGHKMFGIYLKNKEMVYKPNEGLVKADRIAERIGGSDIEENHWRIFTALRLEDGLEIVISPVDSEIVDRIASSAIDYTQDIAIAYKQFMSIYSKKIELDNIESHIFNASECRQNRPIQNLIFICDKERVSYGWIEDSNREPFNTEYKGSLLESLKSL